MLVDTWLEVVIGVMVGLMVVVVTFFKWSFQYWKRKNCPYFEPSIPFGNIENPFNRSAPMGIQIKRLYDRAKAKGYKILGVYMYASPHIVVADLEHVKNILTKDFQHFTDRGFYHNEKDDPISAHLLAVGGTKWRNLRTKFTTCFTAAKMRMMFELLKECENSLQRAMKQLTDKGGPIDVKEVYCRFTTDIIASCAFGIDCKSVLNQESPFRYFGKKVFTAGGFSNLRFEFATYFPKLANALGMRQLPPDVSSFYFNTVKDTVEYREKNDVSRKDFLQLLIDLKNNESQEYQHDGNVLTIEEVAAQCFIFFMAGFETSSTASTFALYGIAKHEDVQDKVRAEINKVLAAHDGKITYEAVNEMKYLAQVVDEAMRIYPAAPILTRKCVKDYVIPGEGILIKKGVRAIIPALAIHRDPDNYPNPNKFDPERFSDENKRNRNPYSFLAFGEGPRNCIGLRFGLLQSKVGIISILRDYRLTVNARTQDKEPIDLSPYSFIPTAKSGIWLDAEKL